MTNTNRQKGRLPRLPLLCLPLLLLLSGCLAPEQLMQAPRPAPQYQRLQSQIDGLLSEGFTYSAPAAGDYRSPVEMKDLTGDGREEAIVFLRGETYVQMVVFLPSGDGYLPLPAVTENAESVHSVAFHDFNGNGELEIVVGWQLAGLRSVSVYTLVDNTLTEILSRPYSGYVVYDAGHNGCEEGNCPVLFLVQLDAAEQKGVAEIYAHRGEEMPMVGAAYLSRGVDALLRVRTGPLSDGSPGFLVASKYQPPGEFQTAGEVTDVFAFRGDALVNVSLNMETGVSNALVRQISIAADDINGDGVLDLPRPVELPRHPDGDAGDVLYEIRWSAYDSNGASSETARTYHSPRNGWYLLLPEQWPETEQYTVRHTFVSAAQTVTTFSLLQDGGTAADFLSIYYITHAAGDKTQTRGRTVLVDETLLLVAAELTPLRGDLAHYNVSEAELKALFFMIPIEWRGGL